MGNKALQNSPPLQTKKPSAYDTAFNRSGILGPPGLSNIRPPGTKQEHYYYSEPTYVYNIPSFKSLIPSQQPVYRGSSGIEHYYDTRYDSRSYGATDNSAPDYPRQF